MRDSVFPEEGGDGAELFSEIFAAFIGAEVNQGGLGLVLRKREPRFENLEDGRGGSIGYNVYPGISSRFINEGNEVLTVSKSFGRDRAYVGIDVEQLSVGSLVD